MAAIRGTDTNLIFKEGSTHGTAVQGTTNDKIPVESFNGQKATSELTSNNIGTGISMEEDTKIGATDYTVDISMQAGFNNGAETISAMFFGAASSPAEQNVGEGDYMSRITYDPTQLKFGTWARDSYDSGVLEYPSCYPTSLTFTQARDAYLQLDASFIADDEVTTGTTNTNVSLASATVDDATKIIGRVDESFLVNTQAGSALASPTDDACPSSFTLALTDAKEANKCFSGGSSDGAPIRSGLLTGELTLEFLQQDDHTWIDWRDNETALKCSFDIQGSQIASGDNYTWKFFIPRMIVTNVTTVVDSAGFNAFTVTCKLLKASANPSGMDDTYPYIEVTNTDSTQITS